MTAAQALEQLKSLARTIGGTALILKRTEYRWTDDERQQFSRLCEWAEEILNCTRDLAASLALPEPEKAKQAEKTKSAFDSFIEPMRSAAKACGYALGVHGSLARDVDLIAAPWTDNVATPDALIEALRVACEGYTVTDTSEQKNYYPVAKPHGRKGYKVVPGCGGTYFDISVIAAALPAPPPEKALNGIGTAKSCGCNAASWCDRHRPAIYGRATQEIPPPDPTK